MSLRIWSLVACNTVLSSSNRAPIRPPTCSTASLNMVPFCWSTCFSMMSTRRRADPVPISCIPLSYPGTILAVMAGTMRREMSRCCFCPISRAAPVICSSLVTAERSCGARMSRTRPLGICASCSSPVAILSWRVLRILSISARVAASSFARDDTKTLSHSVETARNTGSAISVFQSILNTPCLLHVALYVPQCIFGRVAVPADHPWASETQSPPAASAPDSIFGSTCLAKLVLTSWTMRVIGAWRSDDAVAFTLSNTLFAAERDDSPPSPSWSR
mmetsp:Transcript_54128/g.128586  ORF Transcript_54128/g.128586 Transcript_54128/m.128586 type:complete len:275 (+) Transcript_54128:528-1352(+)